MKIILFANTDWYLYNFRLPLAEGLRAQGHEIILLSPSGPYAKRLQALGFHWMEFDFARHGMNPIAEARTLLRLLALYRRERPDVVHHFTVKCILYGSLVAPLAGIKSIINAVTGLGYVFSEGQGLKRWLRPLVKGLYRFSLRGTRVIFQNPDDRDLFVEQGLVCEADAVLIRGSGVDTVLFSPRPESPGLALVVFPGRLLRDKGVGDFVSAARLLRAEGLSARFALVGDLDENNPVSILRAEIQEWTQRGDVEWWGWRENMEEVFSQSHIVCLPSFYKEGLPKVLIEAASSGRPIVTTDWPGCREVVRPGENGLLVPPLDPRALADAIRTLVENPSLRERMGRAGREIAVREFSIEHILAQTLGVYTTMMRPSKETCQN
jgi:glycosyltransferase involved in cell wall biosynthesis